MENNIKGKSILLIAPIFYNYHELIINSLIKQGAKVTFIQEKEYSILSRLLGYLSSYLSKEYHKFFLRSRLSAQSKEDFDSILIIHGEYVDKKILDLTKELFKSAKLISYHWDSLIHNKNGALTVDLYDRVYSFDRSDVDRLGNLKYLPLFHTIEQNDKSSVELINERDLLFIGVDYSDRISIIKKIVKKSKNLFFRFDYFLITSKISYLRKKATFSKRYRNTVAEDFKFEKISHNKFLDMIRTSKCVLDINVEGQAGLTMRTIEVLALGKKLITTNEWIKHEPFYNENLILIINRKEPNVVAEFIKSETPKIDMSYYHLDNWVKALFN